MKRLVVIAFAVLTAGWSGCALISPTKAVERLTADRHFLQPLPADRNIIDLEVYFVDRVMGDPTIGDALWRYVNQADGSLSNHARLREVGIQYGVVPSTPPASLQALISRGLGDDANEARKTSRVHLPIVSGSASEIAFSLIEGERTLPGAEKKSENGLKVDAVACTFRVSAEKLQEGWVRMTFLPEIKHGADQLRRVATTEGWEAKTGRMSKSYYDSEFSVELNMGEFVVLGMAGKHSDSLGQLFFRGWDPGQRFERVVVIRVAGMQRAKAIRGGKAGY